VASHLWKWLATDANVWRHTFDAVCYGLQRRHVSNRGQPRTSSPTCLLKMAESNTSSAAVAPRPAIRGQVFVASYLWPAICGQPYVASYLSPVICDQLFVASHLWPAVICGPPSVVRHLRPIIRGQLRAIVVNRSQLWPQFSSLPKCERLLVSISRTPRIYGRQLDCNENSMRTRELNR
jgi:hypothetical protein